jgi:hypothetical protein
MTDMRRTLGSVGAWLLATGLAVLVSWLGVQSVRFAAVPDRVSPMSAAEARKVVPRTVTPTPAPEPTADAVGEPTPSASATPTASLTATPSAAPVTPTPDDSWTPVPDGRGGTALLRDFTVTGGTARIRFAQDEVRVVQTVPAAGFGASFKQLAPTMAVVTFSSPDHTSTITAQWDRRPQARIDETPTAAS